MQPTELLNLIESQWHIFTSNPDQWKILTIPFVCALVGWITNYIGVKMVLYPIEFIGIRPFFGWQGILPAKSEKIAQKMMEKTIVHLGSLEDLFHAIEPAALAESLVENLDGRIEEYIDEIMEEKWPVAWTNTPLVVRKRFYKRVRESLPSLTQNFQQDIEKNLDRIIDLESMIVTLLSKDKALLVRVFREIGHQEMRFAINSGLIFGFIFGCVQAVAWFLYPVPWILPLFGAFVGVSTNWLVLYMIFSPVNPIVIAPKFETSVVEFPGFTLQGLFMRRQSEVAVDFSQIMARDIINSENIAREMLAGNNQVELKRLLSRNLKPLIEGGMVKTILQVSEGFEGYVKIKDELENKTFDFALEALGEFDRDQRTSNVLRQFFTGKINELSPEAFQNMLRPVFQEDEWLILLLGAALGSLIGLMQYLVTFAS